MIYLRKLTMTPFFPEQAGVSWRTGLLLLQLRATVSNGVVRDVKRKKSLRVPHRPR